MTLALPQSSIDLEPEQCGLHQCMTTPYWQGRTEGKKWPGSYCQTAPLNTRRAAHSIHGALPTQCIARIDQSVDWNQKLESEGRISMNYIVEINTIEHTMCEHQ